MSVVDSVHGGLVHGRRVRTLAKLLAWVVPQGGELLDVGCGDGLLSSLLAEARGDLTVSGIDVLARPDARIPVALFDGTRIPRADRSVDTLLFVDVLHHTEDPMVMLREAARVARRAIVVKDHTLTGFLAGPTLRFMDWIGNARHGVALPYNYWTLARWTAAFRELHLEVEKWIPDLGLYPWPASLAFSRKLHFITVLTVSPRAH